MGSEQIPRHPAGGSGDGPAIAEVGAFLADSREDLVALAYVMTASQDEAQDVVHDVFLRLLRTDLTGVADLRAYARRAITNECATWGRRLTRSRRRSRSLHAEWQRVLATQPDPHGRVEVLTALSVLSTRQRTAVVLRYYLDWDDEAIAETLHCAPSTVRTVLSRAMKKLRADLADPSEPTTPTHPDPKTDSSTKRGAR